MGRFNLLTLIIVTGLPLSVALNLNGATIRVDHESTASSPDGSSWSNAFANLQDGLDYAATHTGAHSLWIADGVYYPTVRTDAGDARSVTFSLITSSNGGGVVLYGGFQGLSRSGGGETSLNQRNPDLYETTLSGNIGSGGSATDNAYHVVTAVGVDSGSRLNGFTIRDGYADGDDEFAKGGGLWIDGDATPLIIRCRFTSNYAESEGGAVDIAQPTETVGSGTQFLACTFDNNTSDGDGGAIATNGIYYAYGSITLANCLAYDNASGESEKTRFPDIAPVTSPTTTTADPMAMSATQTSTSSIALGAPRGGVADVYPADCGDSNVDIDDLVFVITHWGSCSSFGPSDPIDEEAAIAILLAFMAEHEVHTTLVLESIDYIMEHGL